MTRDEKKLLKALCKLATPKDTDSDSAKLLIAVAEFGCQRVHATEVVKGLYKGAFGDTIQDSAYWHIFSCGVAIKNTNYHTYPLGRVVMVEDHNGNACRGCTSDGKTGNWINYTDMRPATEEEIDAFVEELP